MTEAASAPHLSFGSYNIHRCWGTDRKYRPERVAEVLRALDCDVVGLQEVDTHLTVDGYSQLDFLAESLGMRAVSSPNLHDHRGSMGNALLTRLPIRKIRRGDLSVRNFEPRGLLDVELDAGNRTVRVIVTHLGLRAAERRLQVRRLIHHVEEQGEAMPMVILGDFNEWRPTGGALRSLNRRFGRALAPRTFPSRFPMLPLDRMWIWPAHGLLRLSAYSTPLSRLASDHLPIRADVRWSHIPEKNTL
ncbi:endonuclease/exonuclease/phosphatase family protein [Telmatospirillum sp. J64-1]|uniref:endonuclease/exonuclease/phosphatase family protein n=1 Tax=Telmatospirillum sp. J64-1 TaxID=2502183 RepID=UPI00115F22E5|nr:endonuclease/exonuclease/phosphatase family protein [Telmatospirillum sp. J64-1]